VSRTPRAIPLVAWFAFAPVLGCAPATDDAPIAASSAYEHELFVMTSGPQGRSLRIRVGEGLESQALAADGPAFYDGTSLVRFERMELSRSVLLQDGGTYEEERVRLTEQDGLGSGRWVHEHGLFTEPPSTHEGAILTERSGKDLVAIAGTLRGIRVWSEGSTLRTSYVIHDRFGQEQDLLKLYGPQHRDLIGAARQLWDAIPSQQRACYRFDYKSSYLRPAPGGVRWVMHGTAAEDSCAGTTLPVEVEAPVPLVGGIDAAALGDPGDAFLLGPFRVEEGETVRIHGPGGSLDLPGGDGTDPPLIAIHWMPSADIPDAHVEALARTFSDTRGLAMVPDSDVSHE